VWRQLLEAEDAGEEMIHEAEVKATQTIERRRADASAEVDRLRADHARRLKDKKDESDAQVSRLQEGLQAGQQEKKAQAAEAVRGQKAEIIKILLSAVLTVPIDGPSDK
jgi:sirohydrochlorin ferrochelatase